MTIYQKFKREIQAWNWPAIIVGMEIIAETDFDDPYMTTYLGSCLSLAPSGKYYMPFACSNVAGDCPFCRGRGANCNTCGGTGSLSAYQDQEFYSALEDVCEEQGGWYESGEGNPTDLYFSMGICDLRKEQ